MTNSPLVIQRRLHTEEVTSEQLHLDIAIIYSLWIQQALGWKAAHGATWSTILRGSLGNYAIIYNVCGSLIRS